VHAHALITGNTHIGEENKIFSFSAVGNPPQDLKYQGQPTLLRIGNKNIIREYATLQPGTVQGGGTTLVGHENLFMAYTHVAHDCVVGNQNVLSNGVQLAGHVTIHNMAILGGLSAVHQFVHIGDLAMLASGSLTVKDIPPYCISEGVRATLRGLNTEGMRRRNVSSQARAALKAAYKILFYHGHGTIDAALQSLQTLNVYPEVQKFVEFIKNSKRGVAHPKLNVHRHAAFLRE
jgi:UDP-N-acetylglucosamine acyltransferase